MRAGSRPKLLALGKEAPDMGHNPRPTWLPDRCWRVVQFGTWWGFCFAPLIVAVVVIPYRIKR